MLKKFVGWFIVFGLSFLVSNVFHWGEQGKVFLFINLGIDVIIIFLIVIALLAFAGTSKNIGIFEMLKLRSVSLKLLLCTVISLLIVVGATWVATKLFGIDFYVAYQIMTFGQCLCEEKNDKNN